MKICAIICEYNPFHSGHLYQLMKASELFDAKICLMSGNFVQRAEPAVAEKYVRAQIALNAGADMVMELPVIYATANGERFACGAVKTLKNFGDIDALVMGCETENKDALLKLAAIQSEEDEKFKSVLNEKLDCGFSYASSLTAATVYRAELDGIPKVVSEAILSLPNNLLCIEYIKAIKKCNLDIKPVLIQRKGNNYNSISFSGNYISATALRELLKNGKFTEAMPYLTNEYKMLFDEYEKHKPDMELFDKIAVYTLRNISAEELRQCFDCREGIENKLTANALKFINLMDILSASKSKRYTLGRLKRIVLQAMLGINKELMTDEPYIPPRLLAIKETFKPYLTENAQNMIIRSDDFARYCGEYYDKYFAVEKRAAALYSVVTNNSDNLFPPSKLYSI